jgi:hypothetical protein
MAPIKGFGCGRFAVTQHRGLLNDGANIRNSQAAHFKNDEDFVDSRVRRRWK